MTMMRPRTCPRCLTEPRPRLRIETDSVGGPDWVCISGHRFPVNQPLPHTQARSGGGPRTNGMAMR
jgi:hypothetical protein